MRGRIKSESAIGLNRNQRSVWVGILRYSGILQADAYGDYNTLYETGHITEAACMAHARRKIHDVHTRTPTDITTEALRHIGELYAIEAAIRGSPAEERLAIRKARNVPMMQSLYDWVQQQITILSRHPRPRTCLSSGRR